MAKKVIAKSRTKSGKGFAKVIRAVRSPKTQAYSFKEEIVSVEEVQKALHKK